VFLDPPYHKNLIPPALKSLKDGGWLSKNALLVAETSANEIIEAPGFNILDEREYGETRVRILSTSE
jgi:16S rRNA (guanine966-N2)-methyltransferase